MEHHLFAVVLAHDGVVHLFVDLPQAWGTKAQCIQFIAGHRPPRPYTFELMNLHTRQLVSYAVEEQPGAYRLHVQDCYRA